MFGEIARVCLVAMEFLQGLVYSRSQFEYCAVALVAIPFSAERVWPAEWSCHGISRFAGRHGSETMFRVRHVPGRQNAGNALSGTDSDRTKSVPSNPVRRTSPCSVSTMIRWRYSEGTNVIEEFVSRHGVRAIRHLLNRPTTDDGLSGSRLSISQRTTYRWPLSRDVGGLVEAGVGSIGLWRQKIQDCGEQRAIRLLRQSKLRVSSVSWAGGFTGVSGFSFNESVQDARSAICTAAALRAGCLTLVSGPRGLHTRRNAGRLLDDALGPLLRDAERFGVTLALQPMHPVYSAEWTFLNSVEQALEVIRRWNNPRLKLAFDAYHFGGDVEATSRIAEFAAETAVVQLSDRRGDRVSLDGNRCLPGDGRLPLREIVQSFLAGGFDGQFELDVWSDDVWQSDYHAVLGECRSRFAALAAAGQPVI